MTALSGKPKAAAFKEPDKVALFKDLEKHILDKEKDKKESGVRKSFDLLFRASEHGCNPDAFHMLCDGKGPTVTILYGIENVVFGGFTSQSWLSAQNCVVADDKAFLFFKENFQDAKLKTFETRKDQFKWAITCDKNFGPTFGGGRLYSYDLQTFKQDKSTIKRNPVDNCFHLNGSLKFNTHYQSVDVDANLINGVKMVVSDIEVYMVKNEFDKEWRHEPTVKELEQMKKRIKSNDPEPLYGIRTYNVLLLGQIGSGKSSYYNTLATLFSGQIEDKASAGGDETSITNKLHEYELESGMHVRIFDIRGYEEKRDYHFEIDHLLDGKLENGYEFPESSAEVPLEKLKRNTTLKDEIHVACFVEDVTQVHVASNKLKEEFRKLRKKARKRELPIMVISTKFDDLCPLLKESPILVYRSPKAEESTRSVATLTGVSPNLVFPIINYTDDRAICPAKDMLALQSLDKLVSLAENYVKEQTALTKKIDILFDGSKSLFNQKTEDEMNALKRDIGEMFNNVKEDGLRILCFGAAKSGKSSFVDSVLSTASGTISNRATGGMTQSADDTDRPISLTKKFKLYPIKFKTSKGEVISTSVDMCDMPGLQKQDGIGWNDIKCILQGNVPGGYRIVNHINKESKGFVRDPEKKHKIHCVCFIIDVTTVEKTSLWEQDTFQTLKTYLHGNDIPYIAVLTKIDKLLTRTPEKEKRQQEMKTSINTIREKFQFRRNLLFHVKNYVHEDDVNPDVDSLILDALMAMLKQGEDGFRNITDDDNKSDEDSEENEEFVDDALMAMLKQGGDGFRNITDDDNKSDEDSEENEEFVDCE